MPISVRRRTGTTIYFQKVRRKIGLAHQDEKKEPGRNGRKLVKNILGRRSSDGMPISKERGRRYWITTSPTPPEPRSEGLV